jgi:CheY-like chemotaxis protein
VRYDGVDDVACAIELTEDSVFVISDMLPSVGADIDLRLSFPHAIEPISIRASVVQVRIGSGPGTPTGFVASFEISAEKDREVIRRVVRRLAASTLGTPTRDLRVLLVEDNRLVSDMFSYALKKFFDARGSRVTLEQASDLTTAWAMLRASQFDLVIVDYFLREEEVGATLIERLRSDPRLATTSVVAISVGGSDVRRATLSAGADLFLHKPIVLRDLFHTLEFLTHTHDGAADAGAA